MLALSADVAGVAASPLSADEALEWGLVNRVAGVYPRFTKSLWNDESAIMALDYLLQYEKPDLSLVNLTDLDSERNRQTATDLGAVAIRAFGSQSPDQSRLATAGYVPCSTRSPIR